MDCRGSVDVADAVLFARLIAEDPEARPSRQGVLNSDVNDNGHPDPGDVIRILKHIAKLIPSL